MLRQLTPDDIPHLLQHVNNPKITDRILNFPYPYEEHHAVFRLSYIYQGFKNGTHYVFAIIFRPEDDEIFAGEISLHLRESRQVAELGYWVAESFWNQGIASEAIAAIVNFGIEKLQLRMIYAECHSSNPASHAVLKKNNFVLNGPENEVVKYVYDPQYNS